MEKKRFENIVGKGENAGNQHFPLFPPCFLSYQRKNAPLKQKEKKKLSSANAFNLDKAKILSPGKKLTRNVYERQTS